MEALKVEDIKRGEYVKRKPDAKKVYMRSVYQSGRYTLTDADDHCRTITVKKGTVLYVGFTY